MCCVIVTAGLFFWLVDAMFVKSICRCLDGSTMKLRSFGFVAGVCKRSDERKNRIKCQMIDMP